MHCGNVPHVYHPMINQLFFQNVTKLFKVHTVLSSLGQKCQNGNTLNNAALSKLQFAFPKVYAVYDTIKWLKRAHSFFNPNQYTWGLFGPRHYICCDIFEFSD